MDTGTEAESTTSHQKVWGTRSRTPKAIVSSLVNSFCDLLIDIMTRQRYVHRPEVSKPFWTSGEWTGPGHVQDHDAVDEDGRLHRFQRPDAHRLREINGSPAGAPHGSGSETRCAFFVPSDRAVQDSDPHARSPPSSCAAPSATLGRLELSAIQSREPPAATYAARCAASTTCRSRGTPKAPTGTMSPIPRSSGPRCVS